MSRFVVMFLVFVGVCLGQQSAGASGHDTSVCEKCNPCEDTLYKSLKQEVPMSLTDEDKKFIKIKREQCDAYRAKSDSVKNSLKEREYQVKLDHQLHLYTPDHTPILIDSTGVFWGKYQHLLEKTTSAPYDTRKLFGTLTIIGGVVVGVSTIIWVSSPTSSGAGYAMAIALPVTLIVAGIGLMCK